VEAEVGDGGRVGGGLAGTGINRDRAQVRAGFSRTTSRGGRARGFLPERGKKLNGERTPTKTEHSSTHVSGHAA
jgi:hypothetical protein